MMDLTIDEKMLILLYSPGTRMGLYGALQQMKEQLEEDETELLDLTNSVLQKLSDMDDEVFEKLSLSLDLSRLEGNTESEREVLFRCGKRNDP